MIGKALPWAPSHLPDNHQGQLFLSVSEAPSPRKLRNDSPGIMPPASLWLVCVTQFPFLFCPSRPPCPLLWPLQISEIPAKSEGLDILVQNCLSLQPRSRRPHVLTHSSSLFLLWHDTAPNVSLSPRVDESLEAVSLRAFLPA